MDHVAFTKKGKLIRQENLEDLKCQVKRLCFESVPEGLEEQFELNVLSRTHDGGGYQIVIDNYEEETIKDIECRVEHLNLEELFLVYNAQGVENQA